MCADAAHKPTILPCHLVSIITPSLYFFNPHFWNDLFSKSLESLCLFSIMSCLETLPKYHFLNRNAKSHLCWNYVISTGHEMTNLVWNFEYLVLLSFLTVAKFKFGAPSRYYKGALTQKRYF